jgi:phosphoserine aminotransferase
MISFYPGPSKVYPQVPGYVQDAYDAGLLSANHRSPEFVEVSSTAIRLLKDKLHIPQKYTVFFTSSATECWEIISQSLVREKSFHIFNGAFGEKWYQYAQQLQTQADAYTFGIHEVLNPSDISVSANTELIAVTHNETSNGTAVDQHTISALANQHPEALLAVDATSSMAGVALDFSQADVWYASVQKCFGLPAGMAVMLCSPRALERAAQIGERQHYNSLLYLQEMMQKFQTTYTPNVLNIYLLMRVMQERSDIQETQCILQERYQAWIDTLSTLPYLDLLITNEAVRSLTVIPFTAEKPIIDQVRRMAREQGMVLGNGYGFWKESSLRIANFPALEASEIKQLRDFFFSLSV